MDVDIERLADILTPYIILRKTADAVSVSHALAARTGMGKKEIQDFLDTNHTVFDSPNSLHHTVSLPSKDGQGLDCTFTTTIIRNTQIIAFSETGQPVFEGGACIPETLATMARYSPSACLIGENGIIVYANDALHKLIMHEPSDLMGSQLIRIISRQSREAFIRACDKGLQDPEGIIPPGDLILTPAGERRVFVSMKGGWLKRDKGNLLWMVLNDVTEQVMLMRKIREQEEQFSDLFHVPHIGLLYVNPRGMITSCNAFVSNLMGYAREEIQGSSFTKFVAPHEEQRLREEFQKLFVEGSEIHHRECVLRTREGDDITIEYDAQVISRKKHNIQALMVFSDITGKKALEMELLEKNAEMEKTLWEMAEVKDALEARAGELNRATEELKVLNERLNQLSITDGLTEIYNHRHFQDRLSEEVERVQRSKDSVVSLLILDIDDFKHFNDTYGHQCGDMVLKQLAGILRNNVRSIDVLARYGGEEFAVVLPSADTEEAANVAERICEAVRSTPFSFGEGTSVKVTVSIGVGSLTRGQGEKSELIRKADNALYAAKAKWKDRVEVWEED